VTHAAPQMIATTARPVPAPASAEPPTPNGRLPSLATPTP
jgi:hypothetical protein